MTAISIGLVILRGNSTQRKELGNLESVLVQLVITFIGSAGSYIIGELRREKELSHRKRELVHVEEQLLCKENQLESLVKDRGRHLHRIQESFVRSIQVLQEAERVPDLGAGGQPSPKLEAYTRAAHCIAGQTEICLDNIRDCLNFWGDLAPEGMAQLRKERDRKELPQ